MAAKANANVSHACLALADSLYNQLGGGGGYQPTSPYRRVTRDQWGPSNAFSLLLHQHEAPPDENAHFAQQLGALKYTICSVVKAPTGEELLTIEGWNHQHQITRRLVNDPTSTYATIEILVEDKY